MPDEKIELTPQEVEEIKDGAAFQAKTTLSLKILIKDFRDHCESSQKFRNDVTRIKVYTLIHTWIILCIIYALIKSVIGKLLG